MTDIDGIDVRFVLPVMVEHREDRRGIEKKKQTSREPADDFDRWIRDEAPDCQHDKKDRYPEPNHQRHRPRPVLGEHGVDSIGHGFRLDAGKNRVLCHRDLHWSAALNPESRLFLERKNISLYSRTGPN